MEFLVYPRGLKLKLLRGPHEDYKVIRGPHYDANATIAKLLFISFIFMPAFPLGQWFPNFLSVEHCKVILKWTRNPARSAK